MIPPELAAHRFAYACLTGAALGAVYGFLRPLRPRRTTLAAGLFVGIVGSWTSIRKFMDV